MNQDQIEKHYPAIEFHEWLSSRNNTARISKEGKEGGEEGKAVVLEINEVCLPVSLVLCFFKEGVM